MTASVTHLRVTAPQPAPAETGETFTFAMYQACIEEGYRRACEEFGIPYFPQASPSRSRHLSVLGPVS